MLALLRSTQRAQTVCHVLNWNARVVPANDAVCRSSVVYVSGFLCRALEAMLLPSMYVSNQVDIQLHRLLSILPAQPLSPPETVKNVRGVIG